MKTLNQTLSVAVSLALAVTAAPWQAYAVETAPMPEFVKTFTPPTRLGYVVDHFEGQSKNPVILIQDLHANLGVQQKIVALLNTFKKSLSPNSQPIVIGREAEWTKVDLSYLMSKPMKVRKPVSDVLLKHAEIAGTEEFALMSDTPVNIMGIDSEADYQLQGTLIRASFAARMKLAAKADRLREMVNRERRYAPVELKRIWKVEEQYQKGEVDLDQVARRLHLPSLDYAHAEQAILDRKLALAANTGEHATLLKNAVLADHYLSILDRLFRQQMTFEEVSFAAQHAQEILGVVSVLMPQENINDWAEAIRAAIDYYALAVMRDKPLAENALKLATDHADQPVAIVTGGFHTDGISKILRERGMSYVVIAPIVESNTLKDEMVYLSRIMQLPLDPEELSSDLRAAVKSYTANTFGEKVQASGPIVEGLVDRVESGNLETPIKPAEGNKNGNGDTGVDLPFVVNENAPYRTVAPAADEIDAALQQQYAPLLDDAISTVKGWMGDRFPHNANVKVVIASNKTAERTFQQEDGSFVMVIAPETLQNIKAQPGTPAYARQTNALAGAVLKGFVNVARNSTSEIDTLPEFFHAMIGNIGIQATIEAFQTLSAGLSQPLIDALQEIQAAMGNDVAKGSAAGQARWLREHQAVVMRIVFKLLDAMRARYNISYDDDDTAGGTTGVLHLLQKANVFPAAASGALGGIQMFVASKWLHWGNPSDEQLKRMIAARSVFEFARSA